MEVSRKHLYHLNKNAHGHCHVPNWIAFFVIDLYTNIVSATSLMTWKSPTYAPGQTNPLHQLTIGSTILDLDMEYLEYLTDHYQLVTTTYQDFFDFDQRHLRVCVKLAHELLEEEFYCPCDWKNVDWDLARTEQARLLAEALARVEQIVREDPTPTPQSQLPTSVPELGLGTFGVFPISSSTTTPPKGTTPNSKTPNPTSVAELGLGTFGVFPISSSTTTPPKGTTAESFFGTRIDHKDGVTTPSAITVTHKDGVTYPSILTVPREDGVTTPPVPINSLRKTSIISRFQEQFTMFNIKILFKPAVNLDADSYLGMTCPPLPSFSAQPALKPPWNLSKVGVY